MLDQLSPAARWGLLAALLVLGVVGAYLNTRSEEARLEDTGVIFEGTVYYDGKPLPYAVVRLYPDESPPREGAIASEGTLQRDGSLRIESAPIGKVKISINTAEIRGRMMGDFMAASLGGMRDGKKAEAPNIIDVPSLYFSPETSGLVETLGKGVNKIKIELSSKSSS
jgi:hypothetical protein